MVHLAANLMTLALSYLIYFFTHIDSAYLEFLKIITGSLGWVGGLTLFMWMKERNKKRLIKAQR